ncbi:hypothetical protein BX600DRAFT_508850 [Xylariales sp. PMI_506]|nr:hypothetical protein BX600DRAFT_508850 [Xylariales sp. PMI_506]
MEATPAIYQDIIKWATAQQHSKTKSPISPAQRKALLDLHHLIATPHTSPDIGETNWVGLLHRFRDANPDPAGVSFVEGAVGSRWVYYAYIKESSEPFPGPAGGLDPATGKARTFAKKKDAKQYAARCAVEWLVERKMMPNNGDVKFTNAATSISPPTATTSGAAPPVGQAAVKKGTTSGGAILAAAPSDECSESGSSAAGSPLVGLGGGAIRSSSPFSSPSSASATSELSNTILVNQLCDKLHIRPPEWQLTADETEPNRWSGQPVFNVLESHNFPPGLGQVKDVRGRDVAQEKMAEGVLRELRGLEAARKRKVQDILGSLRPAKR